jgi:tRNA threonylcarbamoyladenosine biosynthesis protein TsaB
VAVARGDRLLAEAGYDTRSVQTENLLGLTRRLLDDLEIRPSDLARIAFSEGPGSFTGLRIGMASALGIAAGTDLPLVPIPSLEVLAYPWRQAETLIAVATGLRRGQLYLGAFAWTGERFREALSAASYPVPAVPGLLASLGADDLLLVGDAVDSLEEMTESRFGKRVRRVVGEPARASHVAFLAVDPLRQSWRGLAREGKTPRYLRYADARRPANRAPGPGRPG